MDQILDHILVKEDVTEDESAMRDHLKEIQQIQQDYNDLIKFNKIRVYNKQRELCNFRWCLTNSDIPKFVENNKRLKEVWIEKWQMIVANSFDLKDVYYSFQSILVPDNSATYEGQLDAVIKKQR